MSLALTFTSGPVASAGDPSRDEAIAHVLNRLAYGPRPGDVERVRAIGLERWIDHQLHPERVANESLDNRLAPLPTIGLSSVELMGRYDVPREAKMEIRRRRASLGENAREGDLRTARRDVFRKFAEEIDGTPRQVLEELQSAKILRAVYSERQLDEILVDFWMNHFNVYARKGPDRFLIGEYEREVVRSHAWGKFEALLRATAESPAMLFYLDNWLSSDPNAKPLGRRRPAGENGRKKHGLNENYAREIMELHTLGVDGGYTQHDVTEVARCFTGWTIRGLRSDPPDPRFAFVPALHDRGDKSVLGHRIKGGGKEEADHVVHILATHPATARFISLKLARRFVADEPPSALVDRAAETFTRTAGDIRAVVTTILTSPEFLTPETRGAKTKTPLEFVASAVRASGADVRRARELAERVAAMGMPLYLQQAPTGYADTSDAWLSTGGLLARMNFAVDLLAGKVSGTVVEADATRGDSVRPTALRLGSPDFQKR